MSFCWLRRIPAPAVSLLSVLSLWNISLVFPSTVVMSWLANKERGSGKAWEALSDVVMWNCLSQANEIQAHRELFGIPWSVFSEVFCKLIKLKYYLWMPLFQNLHTALAVIAWCRMNGSADRTGWAKVSSTSPSPFSPFINFCIAQTPLWPDTVVPKSHTKPQNRGNNGISTPLFGESQLLGWLTSLWSCSPWTLPEGWRPLFLHRSPPAHLLLSGLKCFLKMGRKCHSQRKWEWGGGGMLERLYELDF